MISVLFFFSVKPGKMELHACMIPSRYFFIAEKIYARDNEINR